MIRAGVRRLFRLRLHAPDMSAADADDELDACLRARIEHLVTRGMPAEDARAEALRRLGGSIDEAREELRRSSRQRERRMRLDERLDELVQDLRYATRGLRRAPLFTGFVVATLALGIGANAAMFAVVDRLLLRGPEHIVAPDRVLRVYMEVRSTGMDEITHPAFGYVTYDLLRRDSTLFERVAAYSIGQRSATFGRGADAELLTLGAATSDLFPLLGVRPALGRFFDATEDAPSTPQHVVVLGDGLWRSAFGADRGAIGREITLNDEPYTIVGVAPKGFTGPQFAKVDAWIPMSLRSRNTSRDKQGNQTWTTTWNAQWLRVVVRMKPGAAIARSASAATAAYRHAYTGGHTAVAAAQLRLLPIAYNGQGKETAEAAISRWLVGVAVVVLLIACSNVVNLMLARAIRRRREVAVRLALGAGRGRLIRLFLTEGLLLAALGAIAGLAVAWGTGELMRAILLSSIEWATPPVDLRVLGVSGAIALTVGIVVGLVPALRASRPDLTVSLKSGAREGGAAHGARLRGALTVAQAALSLVLLVGAGLFTRSLTNVRSLDLGIQPGRVLVVVPQWPPLRSSDTVSSRREDERQKQVNDQSLERARALAGVERASISLGLPFQSSFGQYVRVAGWDSIPPLKGGGPYISAVTEDFFETVGTRILGGRAFTAADRSGREPIALVNETMAKTLWPGREAIGECLFTGPAGGDATVCSRIVGVVADARRYAVRESPGMHYYIPLGQERGMCCGVLVIRPRGDAAALIPTVRRMMQELDPTISYISVRTLQESVDPQIRPWRLGATMFGMMGFLALVVAAIGLYSVMSYLVAQRTHEIGVRIALGARGGNIVALILRNSIGMAALGVVLGTVLSLWAGRFVAPLLFNTAPNDPAVMGAVAAILLVVAVFASVLPAMRARRVDPMEALRAD